MNALRLQSNDGRIEARAVLLRYGVALVAVALAVIIRGFFTSLWGDSLPFLTLFPAVLLSAWYGGLGPGIVTTLLGAFTVHSFWPGPFYVQSVGLGIAVFMMLLIAWLTASERQSRNAERMQREYLQVTLASIGDAVIVTNPR